MNAATRQSRSVIFLILGGLASAAGAAEPSLPQAPTSRQDQVAERGRTVMPFDLDRTHHRFSKTDTGGTQTVIAKNPADAESIRLIREHLREIAGRFGAGDFSAPERIHGRDMPGLDVLRKAAPQGFQASYRDTADGGEITYRGSSPEVIDAIHRWFDAQVSDHGRHAAHHQHHKAP